MTNSLLNVPASIPVQSPRSVSVQKWLLFAAICVAIQFIHFVYTVYYFINHDYLPQPFFHDKGDTFMDFYHTLFWADNDGRYTLWKSVYPPLIFCLLYIIKIIFLPFSIVNDGIQLRDESFFLTSFIAVSYLLCVVIVVYSDIYSCLKSNEKFMLSIFLILSPPVLFGLERGNTIFYTLPVIAAIYLTRGFRQILSFAVLINLKPYFVVLTFAYLFKKEYKLFILSWLAAGALCIISGLLLDINFYLFIQSLAGVTSESFAATIENVLSFPTNMPALANLLQTLIRIEKGESHIMLDLLSVSSSLIAKLDIYFVILLLAATYLKRDDLTFNQVLSIICVVMLNMSGNLGAYVLIVYIVALPSLAGIKNFKFVCLMSLLMFMPLDIVEISSWPQGKQFIWLSGATQEPMMIVGAGAILRPIMNFLIMLALIQSQLSISNSSKERYQGLAS